MPHIQHSITINQDPQKVFNITNDIQRWPHLFNEYNAAKILTCEEAGRFTKLIFQLTNAEGSSWRSWRLLDHQERLAIASREDPLFPFQYMYLKWMYTPVSEGTLMTWVQDFEVDPGFNVPLPTVLERMKAHTLENQQRIKELIEAGQA